MAKNRKPEKPVESESESGETGSESESESESEQNQPQIKKLSSISAATKSQPESSSKPTPPSDDEESESESESASDAPEPNVKPLAYKPIDEPKKSSAAKKPLPKEQATPVKASGSKRPAEEKQTTRKENKRSKKKVETEPVSPAKSEDTKRALFQRVFSEEDEIVILKGMFNYSVKKKSDPISNLDGFLEFIKKNLQSEVTGAQVKDKISRLKKKFEKNRSLELEGKEIKFSTAHQTKSYEWSKKVWGGEKNAILSTPNSNGSFSVVKKTPESDIKSVNGDENRDCKEVNSVDRDLGLLISKVGGSKNIEEMISRIGAELFDGKKEVDGENEWKNIKDQEIELYLKKLDLMRAKTKLVLDVLKST